MIKNQSNQFENPFKNQCAQSEALIAVLYNEADELEASEFQHHVLSCAACAREFADFKMLRPQIGEYYEMAFQPLDLSEIILEKPTDAAVRQNAKLSWLERLRAGVASVVSWQQPATAFAAFAICAALLLWFGYAMINQNHQQVASNLQPVNELNNNSTVAEIAHGSGVQKQPLENGAQQNLESKQTPAAVPNQNLNRGLSNRRAQQPNRAITRPTIGAKTQSLKPQRETTVKSAGLEIEADEADDDAPRLSDLLDELGSVQ